MTTRHTITHADELYAGNAFQASYSPDGRRGIKMTHLYAHEFLSTADAAPLAADPNGLLDAYGTVSLLLATELGTGVNWISLCTGALASAGTTLINLDVARNIVLQVSSAGGTVLTLNILGKDMYGDDMAECIMGASQTVAVSGQKAFKSIHNLHWTGTTKLYATAIIGSAAVITLGTGDKLGLPFHLSDIGKFISLSGNGYPGHATGGVATDAYDVFIGLDNTTDSDSAVGATALDVRGIVQPLDPAPDASMKFTALMMVDHTTQRKAFGAPQATLTTLNY